MLLYGRLMFFGRGSPCYRLKTLGVNLKSYEGPQRRPGPPRLLQGLLEVNWWLRKHTERERKNWVGSSGLGQIPRGGYGGFESVFVLEWEGTSCCPSVSQKDGQWPAGTSLLPSPCLAAKQPWQNCWAEGNTRWCQGCTEWTSMPPTLCFFFLFPW